MKKAIRICTALAMTAAAFAGARPAGASIDTYLSITVSSNLGRSCTIDVRGWADPPSVGQVFRTIHYVSRIACSGGGWTLREAQILSNVFVSDPVTGQVRWTGPGASCWQSPSVGCTATGQFDAAPPGPMNYYVSTNYLLWGATSHGEVWTSYPSGGSYQDRIGCSVRPQDQSFMTCYVQAYASY